MTVGQVLSHYRIIDRLGSGGMGEVWLAEDTLLARKVALKFLSPNFASDSERMRRFAQEARVIAALNHPNIAQVYEFDEVEGAPLLAMEYVEGVSLAAMTAGRPLPAEQILEFGIQIADALAEAHRNGIIHRDIKPANIMLNGRGQVKVLDFGLAKVEGRSLGAAASEMATRSLTGSGTVVGTLQYMSPEQCLGREVDPRSDIFSAGAVLYKMATGSNAFDGPTAAAVHDGILNRMPPPPSQLNPALPQELDRIVRRALEKDRELRYQSASDLLADLKRLKRDSESGLAVAAPGRSIAVPVAAFAAGVLVVALLVLGLVWLRRSSSPAALEAIPLTALPGSESQPSFSPDGNQVAFAWNSETELNWDIYVKVVDAGTPLRLTSNPATDYSPAWSPDGKYIVFLRQSDAGSAFFLIPALGGLERKLADASSDRIGVDSPYAAWSPNSRTLALVDRSEPGEPMAIFLHDLASGQRRKLTAPPPKTLGDGAPAFSPDGRSLVFIRTSSQAVQDIHIVPVSGGEPKRLTRDNRRIFGLAWNAADNRILFTSARGGSARLFRISPSGGAPEQVLGIGENASFLAISKQGRRLAYTRSTVDTNVWRFELPGARPARTPPQRLISSTRFEQGPQFSPDGEHIVFASNRTGAWEIWLCDREGLNSVQLTSLNGPPTGTPHWAPDGRQIAFDSRPDGNPDVYVIGLEGGTPRRLTTEPSEDLVPSWSHDGKWIYFVSNRSGAHQVWKVPAAGGTAVQITHGGGFHAHESPDGRWLYYVRINQPGIWRVPVDGGAEETVLPSFRAGLWGYWEVVEKGLYYVDRREIEHVGIRYFLNFRDFATTRDRQVLAFEKRPFNSGLAISPDGRWCLYTQVDQSDTDIMLVEGFH